MRKKVAKPIVVDEELSERELYKNKVRTYVREHRDELMDKLVELCAKTDRVEYADVDKMLGCDYPKASWISEDNISSQVVEFFSALDFFIRYDETYVYFP